VLSEPNSRVSRDKSFADDAETLEDILDRATNPSNIGDNTSDAVAFAAQVNKEFDGPTRAVKFISHKLGLHQEIVSLQTLNVVETCVKNCGQRFHQEIGKYRFLNELIKLLSPKYDGEITSQAVKDRVTELLYSWCRGLPHETKIAEAYKMLKQQGVIKRDPVDSEAVSHHSPRPTNTALDDEEKSKLLSTLLKSTNPEDLQAANRLIKTMVKQEEERLEKFSKRVQELENVSNNVNLLSEMISAYNSSMNESDKSLMRDLYEDCLKMRTDLFRMASQSAEDKDDTLSEILSLSDELTRTIDEYKRVVVRGEAPSKPVTPKVNENSVSSSGDAAPPVSGDSLLDLGLDFDPGSTAPESSQSEKVAGSSLLDEQFKMLGLDTDVPSTSSQKTDLQGIPGDEWGAFGSAVQQPIQSPPQLQPQHYQGQFYPNHQFNPSFGAVHRMQQQSVMNQGHFSVPPQVRPVRPVTSTESGAMAKQENAKRKPNDPLGFDVFADFKKDSAIKPNSIGQTSEPNLDSKDNVGALLDINIDDDVITNHAKVDEKPHQPQSQTLSSTDGYFVPMEAIEPTSHSPITTLDKDGVKTILNIVKDKRESSNPHVIVFVFSTMSTNLSPISEFKIEVSVPKTMKSKLQPPSASTLPAFNPLLPPSAITQIMLIANPSKETIRMQIRISYKAASKQTSETITIDSLPIT